MAKTEHQLRVYESIVDLIACLENPTPMVKVNNRINSNTDFPIYLKLERYNPFGSIKDRIALSMIDGAEIKDGQSIIEPSSGNTGIALAALANARGIPIEIAVPERIPEEKKTLLRLLGIEALWEADDKLCPLFPNEGARGLVSGMLRSKDGERYTSPNQYENELNVQAHYKTTGPEIWQQTQGEIDYFFVGFGTCGTLTGVGKYLKEKKPSVKIIGVEPTTAEHNLPGMKRISDLSEDLVPKILDKSLIDETIAVEDEDAYHTGIQIARKGGILVGPTTGAILYAALQYAKEHKGLTVVISPDDAFKYVSFYAPYVKDSSKPKI
ncbi:MAG: cysteine synthase family protein [Deltaproteobacteria bacterium]|nr:cysteine synthase family protein [Deltaproteobacteria bacterium]